MKPLSLEEIDAAYDVEWIQKHDQAMGRLLHTAREYHRLEAQLAASKKREEILREGLDEIALHEVPKIFSAGTGKSSDWVKKRVPSKQAKIAREALKKADEVK